MSTDLPTASNTTSGLREAFLAASFTVDGLLELLGAPAYAALARSETTPALRATRADSPLDTLVRLFLLRQPVAYARALDALPVADALEDGWLRRSTEHVEGAGPVAGVEPVERAGHAEGVEREALRATVDIRPYGGPEGEDWWIVSDLGCAVGGAGGIADQRPDVVLGVGGASTTLAGLTLRDPVQRALDLGTGSGILALHLTRHATEVTATDLNPRALHFTRLTLALSGASPADLRVGSLFEPVEGEEPYDLIVSNPPFVISPRGVPVSHDGAGTRLTYRDGGMRGDELCRTLAQNSAALLANSGFCQLLANWRHVEGEDWRDRVRSWVPRGCDAWIVQREVQDIPRYTELWLRDAGVHRAGQGEYEAQYAAWLEEFERGGTHAIGFGWIALRKTGGDDPALTIEEWTHPVEQPLGSAVREHFELQDFLRTHDDAALLNTRFVLAEGVVQEQVGPPGAEDPEHVVLRQHRGMRRATQVDTVGAGFAGVCDGTLPAGRILDAIAQLVGEDAVQLRDRTPGAIRLLVEQGFLLPVREE